MGTDITGFVEVRPASGQTWGRVIDTALLVRRNYDMFGSLFGIENYANFAPLAAERGLPADITPLVRTVAEEFGDYAFGHSWVSWAELRAMDRDEVALAADSRVHEYQRGPAGELVYLGKAAWNRAFGEHVGVGLLSSLVTPLVWEDGQEWEIEGHLFRAERLRRRDVITPDWEILFDLMARLAGAYGAADVRLVVWFDR